MTLATGNQATPGDPNIAVIAALAGDQTRARMLMALLDGERLPAGELARICGVAKSTASEHLNRLLHHRLVASERCGRHTYYSLASADVAQVLEAIAVIAPETPPTSLRTVRRRDALARARLCYDHLAGRLGVTVADGLTGLGVLYPAPDAQLLVDIDTWNKHRPLGIVTTEISGRRRLARGCVDWTMRRHHLGGALGAALTQRMLQLGWIARIHPRERALALSMEGRAGIADVFGVPDAVLSEMVSG